MKPESWEQRARRLDRLHRRGLVIAGALMLLGVGVALVVWDGSGLTHRCIRIVDAWDLTGDCPKPQDRTPVQFVEPGGYSGPGCRKRIACWESFASTTQTARTND